MKALVRCKIDGWYLGTRLGWGLGWSRRWFFWLLVLGFLIYLVWGVLPEENSLMGQMQSNFLVYWDFFY